MDGHHAYGGGAGAGSSSSHHAMQGALGPPAADAAPPPPPPSIDLTQGELNLIAAALQQEVAMGSVKFRPIPGGKQCAYIAADEIM
jgi:hypothetical protein